MKGYRILAVFICAGTIKKYPLDFDTVVFIAIYKIKIAAEAKQAQKAYAKPDFKEQFPAFLPVRLSCVFSVMALRTHYFGCMGLARGLSRRHR